MTVLVRRAGPDDVPRLARINVDTWRAAYAGIVPAAYLDGLDVHDFENRWRGRLTIDHPGISSWVAEVDGHVAGYASVGPYRPQQDADPTEDMTGWGEVYALYTEVERQGRGAGGAVQDAALAWLRDQGARHAALWVLRDNESSRRWYAAHGWRADGTTSYWDDAGTPLEEVRLVRSL
ncbi:MAG: GNAT family N-acetyltransferase [Nocardioidaceae bacterium]